MQTTDIHGKSAEQIKIPLPLRHRAWRTFYDFFAFLYDKILSLGGLLHVSSEVGIRNEIIAKMELSANTQLLELGCGTAENRLVLPAHLDYVGLDISLNMLRRAKEKCDTANLKSVFVQADAQFLPFRKSGFDRIIAMGVMQHLSSPRDCISELRRVSASKASWSIIDERRAVKRILSHISPGAPSVTFGEYFIANVRTAG